MNKWVGGTILVAYTLITIVSVYYLADAVIAMWKDAM